MPPEQSPQAPHVSATQAPNLAVPIAIVIAGALVAGALFFSGHATTTPTAGTTAPNQVKNFVAVSAADHILGDPNAPVKIVEYTDFECPFCKQFDSTMKQVMATYGKDGKVAWVIRNFPLEQLHPNAPKLAEAAECVAEIGGNDAYWKFLDSTFTQFPVNTFFDFTKLDSTVAGVGVDTTKFEACYTSGKYKDKIAKEFNDAVAAGGQGTPHNIIVTKDGQKVAIPGAQPYAALKTVLDAVLSGAK